MATLAKSNNAVAKKNSDIPAISFKELVATPEIKNTIVETLGKNRFQTFLGSALTIAQDPKYIDMEPNSLFNCLLKSATYNIPVDPNLGYAFPVPYKNKDGEKVAQFQMGTKGIVELAYRTNKYKRLNVKDVREGEIKGYDFFGEVDIQWIVKDREKLPVVGYMAAFELTNGMTKRVYWDNAKIQAHANKYSKAHQYAIKSKDTSDDLWTKQFSSMAEKTVLKDLLKYAPKSIELQNALQFDQAVIQRKDGKEEAIYVDNENDADVIDTTKVYDINPEETKETIVEDAIVVEPVEEKKSEENTQTETQEENDPDIQVISYYTYYNNKEKYQKVNYEDGRDGYQVSEDGKKTIRVRVKK